jgi:hypothetical protein
LLAPDRQAREVDQVQHIGVGQLGREVEGDHVEGPCGAVVLQGEEGNTVSAHRALHVRPRCVCALGHGVVPFVQDLVEDLEPLIGQADLVGVGVHEQPRNASGPVHGIPGAELPADVAGRLRDLGQEGFDPRPKRRGHLPDQSRGASLPAVDPPASTGSRRSGSLGILRVTSPPLRVATSPAAWPAPRSSGGCGYEPARRAGAPAVPPLRPTELRRPRSWRAWRPGCGWPR